MSFILKNVKMQNVTDKVCYAGYNCFNIKPPFGGTNIRREGMLPELPSKIKTKFELFTRRNSDGEKISLTRVPKNFNAKKPIKFIIHGFLQNKDATWYVEIRKAFLKLSDFNVILVDYGERNYIAYEISVANARLVGVDVARLIRYFVKKKGSNYDDIHIIGYSLGAHIAGYAGEKFKGKIGRITGLDPARPLFEFTDKKVKLDPSDAKFVDIIHTSGSVNQNGLGLLEPSGHVDFYPNGGFDQPGCTKLDSYLTETVANFRVSVCSHSMSYEYFIDSINNKNCTYSAYPCESKEDFDKGNCLKCTREGCNKMGYWATPSKVLGSLYLNTRETSTAPYCSYFYKVKLTSNLLLEKMSIMKGKFMISFKSSKTKSDYEILDDSSTKFTPGLVTTHLVSIKSPIRGKITSIFISFVKTGGLLSLLYDYEWSFQSIEVFDAPEQVTARFCSDAYFGSNQEVEFLPCKVQIN